MCEGDGLVCVRLLPGWHIHLGGLDYGPGDVLYVEPDHDAHLLERGHAVRVNGSTTAHG